MRWEPEGRDPTAIPLQLAHLHRTLRPGDRVDIALPDGLDRTKLLTGAGFTRHGTRQRTLPDVVGPGMDVLICGLNPSLYSADAGVPFARPGNRFWPAAVASGLVSTPKDAPKGAPKDAFDALRNDRVGFTDIVKRATVGAAELTAAEYRAGLNRLRWLVAWLQPAVVCFVGLAGWRAAAEPRADAEPRAGAGRQERTLAGAPVYLMPSTSGLNARMSAAEATDHLCHVLQIVKTIRGCRG